MGIEDLKKGQRYDGIIVSSTWDSEEPLNLKISKPLSVQISAFVKGYVSFNQISEIDDVA
jgi:predicted HTH domain antitoxin